MQYMLVEQDLLETQIESLASEIENLNRELTAKTIEISAMQVIKAHYKYLDDLEPE